NVYDITDAPAATPVTIPPVVIVAIPVETLLQVPPPVASARFVVLPTHTVGVPVIATGVVFTVTVAMATQLPNVYDITDVPALTPVTTPPAVIVATLVVTLLHVPPPVASVSVIVEPVQTVNAPP